MNQNERTENVMGTLPVPRLLWKNGIPLMLSLLFSSLFNVVDSIFVSHVSEDALTALSIAAPVQSLMAALGCGIAVGLNAAVSKALGEKNSLRVRQTASASMFLAICAWVLISIASFAAVGPYCAWQTGGNERIAAYAREYLQVCMLFSLGQMGQWVFDRFLIATGRSKEFLVTLTTASVVNLILDPILIYGCFGLPKMETRGAAIATVVGQFCGAAAGILLNKRNNREIPLHFTLRPQLRSIAEILRVGIPTALMQGFVSLTGIFMNRILQGFSSTAMAVYGVCNRIQNLATVGVHGIDNGLIPIAAYNYGAKKRSRIEQSIRWAMIYSLIFTGAAVLLLEIFPEPILRLFDASAMMMELGVTAIRLLAVSYLLSVFGLVFSTSFQALGMGSYSMVLTVTRQVLLPLAFAFLLAQSGRVELVWGAFSLAEIASAPLALWLFGKIRKNILQKL